MDQGEDFSKGLRLASKILSDPEMTLESTKKKSKAAYDLLQWLLCVVPYGKAKQQELGTAVKSNAKSKSPEVRLNVQT